jgi:type IV secretory pathway VirB6-like protein
MSEITADISVKIIKSFSDIAREIVTNSYPIIADMTYNTLLAVAVLYTTWIGIRHFLMFGEPNFKVMFTNLFKIIFFLGIANSYDTFYSYFYEPLSDLFIALPIIVVKASLGNKISAYNDVLQMLSDSVAQFKNVSFESIGTSWSKGFSVLIINSIGSIFLGMIFLCLLASFVIINVLSIVSANMILMLAPIIIGLAAFDETKKYASNMINSFITYAMRPTFSAVAIAIVVFVLEKVKMTNSGFVDNTGEWMMAIIIGTAGIALQFKTEEFASAITGGVSSASSGIAMAIGGTMTGFALGSKGFNMGKIAYSGGKSVGNNVGGEAIKYGKKGYDYLKGRYMSKS